MMMRCYYVKGDSVEAVCWDGDPDSLACWIEEIEAPPFMFGPGLLLLPHKGSVFISTPERVELGDYIVRTRDCSETPRHFERIAPEAFHATYAPLVFGRGQLNEHVQQSRAFRKVARKAAIRKHRLSDLERLHAKERREHLHQVREKEQLKSLLAQHAPEVLEAWKKAAERSA